MAVLQRPTPGAIARRVGIPGLGIIAAGFVAAAALLPVAQSPAASLSASCGREAATLFPVETLAERRSPPRRPPPEMCVPKGRSPRPAWRLLAVALFLGIAGAGLVGRLAYLQVFNHTEYLA